MTMRKNTLFGAIAIMALSACSTSMDHLQKTGPQFKTWQEGMELNLSSDNYKDWLQKDYKALALFENDEMFDYEAAKHFSSKSLSASRGNTVKPDKVSSREIDIKYKE